MGGGQDVGAVVRTVNRGLEGAALPLYVAQLPDGMWACVDTEWEPAHPRANLVYAAHRDPAVAAFIGAAIVARAAGAGSVGERLAPSTAHVLARVPGVDGVAAQSEPRAAVDAVVRSWRLLAEVREHGMRLVDMFRPPLVHDMGQPFRWSWEPGPGAEILRRRHQLVEALAESFRVDGHVEAARSMFHEARVARRRWLR